MSTDVQPGFQFASDNAAGICAEAWDALAQANQGYAAPYGEDAWTDQLANRLREWFETDCEVFLTFNGTAANSLALSQLSQSYHSVVCAEIAHVETDECGGPEFFSNGVKLLLAECREGRVQAESVSRIAQRRSDIHYPKPKVLSVTQSTEMGTVYTAEQLQALSQVARQHGMRVHMDGARFGCALAALQVAPKTITWQAGVDVLCLGGTKIGLALSEVVVFFNRDLAYEFDYRCKQAGQLASKMRFLAAPWLGLLRADAYLKHAEHANRCARRLAQQLASFPQVSLLAPCEANAVFAALPDEWVSALHRLGWQFYSFIGSGGVRFMCSWQTSDAEIDRLLRDIGELAGI